MLGRNEPTKNRADADNAPVFDDEVAVEDRFQEAHQGILGMVFAAYKMRGREMRAGTKSLPLTIIGGFLGSGKTTLLNHLLVSPHGRRLVVLVNDFGRVNIDAALVATQTDDMITLTNGCACCAVSADLTNSLIEIAEREDPPEAIVLEASGVADPTGIAQVALCNSSIRLDGRVVVVDAETIQTLAADSLTSRLFHNQISAADLIVLSKVDLVDDSQRAAARQWLATRYPEKHVVESVKGDLPVELVLGIESRRDPLATPKDDSDHADRFESVSLRFERPLDRERLSRVFDALPKELLRAKGVLDLDNSPGRPTIYQRVGTRWHFETAEPWGDSTPQSSVVFIAPVGVLNRETLQQDIAACIADRVDEAAPKQPTNHNQSRG